MKKLLLLLGLLTLAGCTKMQDNDTMRYIRFMIYDPVFVAYEQGFFEKHGVDIEFIDLIMGGPMAIQAIANGSAEAGVSFIGAIIAAKNVELSVIGVSDLQTTFRHAPLAEFFVRDDDNIYTMADLWGKTIAINLVHASFHHKWLLALAQYGLSENDVQWVVLPFEQQALALENGHVDAIGILQPHTVSVRNNPQFRQLMTAYDIFGERQFSVHVVNLEWAEKNPARVEAFVAAVVDATEWIMENQDKAKEIISQHTGIDASNIENYYFQPNARIIESDIQFWLDYMESDLSIEEIATNRWNRRVFNADN